MQHNITKYDNNLIPFVLELLKPLEHLPQSVQTELVQSILKHEATEEFNRRLNAASMIRTPPNVIEKIEYKDKQTNEIKLTLATVKLGYMQEIVKNYITSHIIERIVVPPHLEEIKSMSRVTPAYVTTMAFDFYLWGQLVHTVTAVGVCEITDLETSIAMASKGCVTDCKKKAFSYLKVCPDVYVYGDEVGLDGALIDMYQTEIRNRYDSILNENQKIEADMFLASAKTVRVLREKFWKLCDRLDKKVAELERSKNAVQNA